MSANYRLLYTIALFSFFLPALGRLVPALSGTGVRWVALVVVGVATGIVVLNRAVSAPRLLFFALLPFWLYALMTAMWSENPNLTLVKWAVFVIGSAVFLYGGIAIGRAWSNTNPFTPIAPLLLVGVGVSLLAVVTGAANTYTGPGLFQGYVNGPNMLGSTIALGTPWLIIEIHRGWHNPRKRAVLMALAYAAAVILVETRSRGAMLFVLIILTFGIVAMPATRRVVVGLGAAMLLFTSYVAFPDFYATTVESYVFKSGRRVLATREAPFDLSLERARDGGNFGVGYGISSGESWDWSWEFTTVGFGREKGNSQLAVLEELGVVGFVFYCLLLLAIVLALVSEGRRARSFGGDRLLPSIMVGFVVAAIVHSAFEAWFAAPGSPEASVFWAVVGLGIGAMQARAFQPGAEFVAR